MLKPAASSKMPWNHWQLLNGTRIGPSPPGFRDRPLKVRCLLMKRQRCRYGRTFAVPDILRDFGRYVRIFGDICQLDAAYLIKN
jgi:hypothetical protein